MMKTHKQIFLSLFFMMVVTACANVATNTPLPVSTATNTPSPTLIPPTATVEPSPTVDPNMPPGTTGESVTIGRNGETTNMMVTSHVINPTVDGGFFLLEGKSPMILINFKVKQGIQAPFIEHESFSSSNGLYFSNLFYTTLMERHYKKSVLKITSAEMVKFNKDLNDGIISIPVTDANGITHNISINRNTKVNIFLVSPDDMTADFSLGFLNSVSSFEDNIINISVASTKPTESLSNEEFTFLILSRLMQIFVTQDQSQQYYEVNKISIIPKVDQLDSLVITGEKPLIKITP